VRDLLMIPLIAAWCLWAKIRGITGQRCCKCGKRGGHLWGESFYCDDHWLVGKEEEC